MYASTIGRHFLSLYNEKNRSQLDAATFFEQVMFPIFFDHAKHLMHVSNSPFFQNVEKRAKENNLPLNKQRLEDLKLKISKESPDASFYVGGSASNTDATTSGQVTSLKRTVDAEELYASWIGNAFSVRLKGGLCVLINEELVLWHLFEGWLKYRIWLEAVKKGNQIETWNGHRMLSFHETSYSIPAAADKDKGLETVEWTKVLLQLSLTFPNQVLPVYVFKFGQMNTSIGFINFKLNSVTRMRQIFEQLIIKAHIPSKFRDKFESEYTFYRACTFGEIGTAALKPADYDKYFGNGKTEMLSFDKLHDQLLISKTWIIAMLNTTDVLLNLAAEAGAFFSEINNKSSRAKASVNELVVAFFDAKSRARLLEAINDLLDHSPAREPLLRQLREQVLTLSIEQVPMFKALVKFEFIAADNSVSKNN